MTPFDITMLAVNAGVEAGLPIVVKDVTGEPDQCGGVLFNAVTDWSVE